MEVTLSYLKLCCVVIISVNRGSFGENIQLYRNENFTGLLFESNSTPNCTNIPQNNITTVHSIQTDACLIVYEHSNCKSAGSQKYLQGGIQLSEYDLGREVYIKSYQYCNEEEGGDQFNLDITNFYQWTPSGSHIPAVLESYKNVCSCVNVPEFFQHKRTWSIDNHHNSLLSYYELDCPENESMNIPAGHNWRSRNMQHYEINDEGNLEVHNVLSFGPEPNSTYYQTSCEASIKTTENKAFKNSKHMNLILLFLGILKMYIF